MARLAVSKDYFAAYARLPRKAQRKADELLVRFQRDSTTLGIHLEPIHGTVDKQLRSARIGDDYRVILRAPETGDVFLVLWADHHDEAYRWAATKQAAVHPATGSLQVFDTAIAGPVVEESGPARSAPEPAAQVASTPGRFGAFDDATLFLAGVPHALLPSVRAVRDDAELDALLPHLPPEAGEVLTGLAAGLGLDDVLEEVLGRPTTSEGAPAPSTIDTTDVVAALARESTQRQFRLLDGELDLDAALKHPLDAWRVFLHPRQRRIAHAHTKGPVRVLGGAGTGKTVVALHRAGFLVREVFTKPDDRVLFTTFNVNLAADIKVQLGKLLEPDQLARVEVTNIDAWAAAYLRKKGVPVRTAFEDDQREHFQSAYDVYGEDGRSLEFHRAEWREVIQEQGLTTEDEYVFAVRKHRGVPLSRAERRTLWPVFRAYRESLEREGLLEPLDVLRRARAEIEAAGAPPHYRAVVVDEVQDFSAEALKLVRAIAGPERPDDLFLVGDAHQRIYRRPTSLSSCGIQVRGRRSQTLRLNYRTTGAICRWSLGVLDGVDVDDLDDGTADRRGYVSLREGPAPTVQCFASQIEEEKAIAQLVSDGLGVGWIPEGVCVVARTHRTLTDRIGPALTKAGIEWVTLEKDEPRRGGVRLATMHRVKGLEFPVVILAGMSKGEVPLQTSEITSDDPLVAELALVRERSLLYVAASRARDELYVFAAGELTPLLGNLAKVGGASARPRPPTLRPSPRSVLPPPRLPTLPPPPADPAPPPTEGTASPPVEHSVAAASTPSAPVSGELAALLTTPLVELELPTRMLNFAREKSLETVIDLVQWSETKLMAQRNLGRKTVRMTREAIEDLTGRRWEALAAIDRGALPDTVDDEPASAPLAVGVSPSSWDTFRQSLSAADRELLLERVSLPARARTFASNAGLVTLGDLAALSARELAQADNFGRKTIKELPGAIGEHLALRRGDERLAEDGLMECWRTLLEGLDRIPRIILTRRSGLAGPSETLKEIGEMFGVSRERIRQLEAAAVRELTLRSWVDVARRRIGEALPQGGARVSELASDPWWSEAVSRPEALRYLVESVIEADAHVITFDDEDWLSRHKESVVAEAWSQLRADAASIPLPAPRETFDALVAPLETQLGAAFAHAFQQQLRDSMILDDAQPGRVVGLGAGRIAKVLAVLRSSPVPLRTSDVEAAIGGRHHVPDEIIRFGDGRIGLREHIPEFEGWRERLVPAAVGIMQQLDPDRQWSCTELLDELRDEHEIPEWLNPFVLAALIKAGTELHYLGRLRVALPGTKDDSDRIHLHDLIEELLRTAGAPLAKDDLVARIRARIGITDFAINQACARPLFVRVDLERVGLLERDVPGGQVAIDEARDEAAAVLERRDRGLSIFHVHEEVQRISATHETWTRELTSSVLHGDPRFRFSQSGAVGLASWESTRVPTRLELVRNALEEAGDRVSVEAVEARVAAHYGEPISRGALAGIAAKLGASLAGDWLVRKVG